MNESGEAHVWTCDGCSSWTDQPVTLEELLDGWGWVKADDEPDEPPPPPGEGVFCPECQ